MITYSINNSETGDQEDFTTKREAIKEAKKKDYTPVYVDIYDEEEANIIGDFKVHNKGKREIL